MELIDKRNSITYDAEKDELKIVTYYNEDSYKNACLRAVFSQYCQYCFLSKDPVVRRTFQHRVMARLRGLNLLNAILITLYSLIMLPYNLDHKSTFDLLWYNLTPLLLLWTGWLFFPSILAYAAPIMSKSDAFPRKKEIQPLWLRITHAFSEQRIFQQEVVFHPDGYAWNMPGPDTSPLYAKRLESNAHIWFDETDLYFLQFENKRNQLATALQKCLHFVERNYSVAEWDLLMNKLHDMRYI